MGPLSLVPKESLIRGSAISKKAFGVPTTAKEEEIEKRKEEQAQLDRHGLLLFKVMISES